MSEISTVLQRIDDFLWGPWMLCLFLGTGIFLMVRMRFLPLRRLGYALRCAFGAEKKENEEQIQDEAGREKKGTISPFASLMTELAATIGTGNIVGVASAMVLGGPGALVWMVLSSLVGLATKFTESMLAVTWRIQNRKGEYCGGPMITLERAFPVKRLGKGMAVLYAAAAVLASFGMGNMTQSNSIASALYHTFGIKVAVTGLILTVLTILIVLQGIRGIAKISVCLVPAMAVLYFGACFWVILSHPMNLWEGGKELLHMSFSVKALAGGVGGHLTANCFQAIRYGISRGVFSNEAGLGAGGISAAAAQTQDPVRQGYISMTGVFLDTVVICSITGLMLIASGVLGMTDRNGEILTGTELTIAAFATSFGDLGAVLVTIGMVLFAFATMIGWSYQGEKAFEYLVKDPDRCIRYRFLYGLITFAGAVFSMEAVWNFADICNALMAIPNLICILVLNGQAVQAVETTQKSGKLR